ncbi:flagellar assembly protein FliT [Bacillus nakamurai]|uniref:Flagellar protein FliT n=1 Tax=Bacillus nakamurai TaxID=1793963 RepID=A0A150F4T2_9BACI|nr:flagellar protein FliT [Bacillus nakamurai]KXZ17201.1 flagellar assembly protein FliT [Bacillus nakamurai]KXZ17282.1 flagellar assembly protein FliT [Bacillus nakamurai]MCC9022370.1 flagellar protein FliT [Bacillus nakamurai]MED1228844.1 flagellar protein FliT [Bacillus nakamurai]
MNNSIFSLYNETKDMYSALKGAPESDSLVESITAFTEKREGMLASIRPPFSAEEKAMLQQVAAWDRLITDEVKRVQEIVRNEIKMLKKKRVYHNTYFNPYHQTTSDGRYYDKRK